MNKLELISKKLELNKIKVTSIYYSDEDICDDSVTLTNGFSIQVGSNYYGLWHRNSKGIHTDFGVSSSLKKTIEKIKQELK
jgi:hypothetical protein